MWFLSLCYEGKVSSCLVAYRFGVPGMKLHWDTVETVVATGPALQPFILPD